MSNGLATRNLLKEINDHPEDDDVFLGPESWGLPRPDPVDPHDVEGRKWLRRMLIALTIAGFLIICMPDFIRARLNLWAGTPTPAVHKTAATIQCTNDWVERCLVCEHHLATGEIVKATHC